MFTVRFLPERLFSSGNTSVGPRVRDLGRTHAEPVVSALLGVGAGGTSGSDGCTCSGEEIARVLLLQVIDNERGANAVTVTPALHPAPGWVSSPSCWKDEDTGPTGTCLAQLHVPVQRGADLGGRAGGRAGGSRPLQRSPLRLGAAARGGCAALGSDAPCSEFALCEVVTVCGFSS